MNESGRLLFVSGYYLDDDNASAEHVWEVSHHLACLGWQVTLVGLTKKDITTSKHGNLPAGLKVVPVSLSQSAKKTATIALWRKVAQVVKQQKYHLAYIRPARKTIFAVLWLRWLNIPYFVELNTNVIGEYRSIGANQLVVAVTDQLEKLQCRYAQGAFSVTEELASYAKSRVSDNNSVWVTGNGFRDEETKLAVFDEELRKSLGVSDHETVLTFLGLLQTWQGVDLVIEALKDLPDTWLWIVGDGPEKLHLQQLANHLGVESQVRWFSYRRGPELQVLLNASDIGIGTLAMYRKKMYEAQPLKVRHYLGVGLPIIIGYKDTMLNDESPGVFYAHTAEEIVLRIKEIQSSGLTRSIAYRQKIREFALENLSWAAVARQTSDILSDWLVSRHKEPEPLE